jgi:hypothetical protein
MPTSRNRAPVEMPWLSICSMAPWVPSTVMEAMPSMMKPMWLTEE